jgi:hypothetical protein
MELDRPLTPIEVSEEIDHLSALYAAAQFVTEPETWPVFAKYLQAAGCPPMPSWMKDWLRNKSALMIGAMMEGLEEMAASGEK